MNWLRTGFAESVERHFGIESEHFDSNHFNEVNKFVEDNYQYFYPPEDPDDYRFDVGNEHELVADVDAQTLIKLVKFLKRGKAPGPDTIHNEVLRLGTTTSLFHHLARLFTSSIQLGYIPTACKLTTLRTLLKPDKPVNLTTSYRPISLISSIMKLFERVIEQRLRSHLEDIGFINKHQSGFRRAKSTDDHLFRLSQSIMESFNRGEHVVAAFLDVEKAFDNVWHNGLRYNIFQLGLPTKMTRWLSDFLVGQLIQINVNSFLSNQINPKTWVPQGSVLSPLLFLIYVNDLPPPHHKQNSLSQFADDTAQWAFSLNVKFAANLLQQDLLKLATWCAKWRIKLNPEKTKVIIFSRSLLARKAELNLALYGEPLKIYPQVKFLGIIFDSKLTFQKGFTKTCNHPQSPPITPNHPQSPNSHPQSSSITQNIVTITPNHPKYCHNHPQSPKILSQPPTITQNIVTTSENVVTDSSNHPNIKTQTQQIWLTLFCENYCFTKKITNLRKSRVKVQKMESKSKKVGSKSKKWNQSPKKWAQSPNY